MFSYYMLLQSHPVTKDLAGRLRTAIIPPRSEWVVACSIGCTAGEGMV